MTIEMQVWRIDDGDRPVGLPSGGMDVEIRLENILEDDIGLVSQDWMIIGRQVPTTYGKFVDLLALDVYGKVVVLELKRDKTPRDVVAQALEYGQWASEQRNDELAMIFAAYQKSKDVAEPKSLDGAFLERFGRPIPGELNSEHQLVVVAASLDADSERVVRYLVDRFSVPIGVVFFKVFRDDGREYLSRAWLVEPSAAAADAKDPGQAVGPWNGETYVSFGYSPAIVNAGLKYGFVLAGGGYWYSSKLLSLQPGERVWVNRVGGYVGVGRVTAAAVPIGQFEIEVNGEPRVLEEELLSNPMYEWDSDDDPANMTFAARIEWLHAETFETAYAEKGFFGNQNPVARPVAASWPHTVERLKAHWRID